MEYLRIKSLFAILAHYGIGIIRSEGCEELDSMIYDSNDMGWLPSKASSFNEDDKIGIMYFDKTDEYVSHFTFEGADKDGFVRSINPIYEDYYIQLGFTFEEISEAATAPPRGKLPSQVMSGTSRTRKDKKTPIASIDHISPWATVDINRSNINFTPQNRLRSCRLPVIQI